MAVQEEAHLQKCLAANVCPVCSKSLKTKVGSGKKKDGVFCSVACYGEWHAEMLKRRHFERLKMKKHDTDG